MRKTLLKQIEEELVVLYQMDCVCCTHDDEKLSCPTEDMIFATYRRLLDLHIELDKPWYRRIWKK